MKLTLDFLFDVTYISNFFMVVKTYVCAVGRWKFGAVEKVSRRNGTDGNEN